MYAQLGADVIGMTQFPEAILARELEICFGTVALVTDYDVGVDDIPPVTHEEVLKVFGENLGTLRDLLFTAIPAVPGERTCPCAEALASTGNA
jgi:5'-methylthioadenosine phosphorylase